MIDCKPLEIFLKATPIHVVNITLSFKQIEQIVNDSLPYSAYTYRQWWENPSDTKDRHQAAAWINAGFKVSKVNCKENWVQFERLNN